MQTSDLWDEIRAEARTAARVETLQQTVRELGQERFGKAPTRKQQAALLAITDAARLQRMCRKVLSATSWTDLLTTP